MYIPPMFQEKSTPVLHELIRTHPFATLVTLQRTGLVATHIPMVLHAEAAESGVLRGHMARANGQWSNLDPSRDALAIFSGVDHYISPSWYPAKRQDGRSYPPGTTLSCTRMGRCSFTRNRIGCCPI